MSLRPGGERRISTALGWIEKAIEAKKKIAPGMNIFRMQLCFNSIITNLLFVDKKSGFHDDITNRIRLNPDKPKRTHHKHQNANKIPKLNIQIPNKIKRQLIGILNFGHCYLFDICGL